MIHHDGSMDTPTPTPVSAPTPSYHLKYLSEYQEHLNVISLSLELLATDENVHTGFIEITDGGNGSVRVRIVDEDKDVSDASSSYVELPHPVETGFKNSINLKLGQRIYEIRIPCESSSMNPTSSTPFIHRPPLSAVQLRALEPASLNCASCGTPLIFTQSSTTVFKDLPSEYWTEMLEAWMCHPDGEFLKQLKNSGGDQGHMPKQDEVLVGNGYFLIRAENAMDGIVVSDATDDPSSLRQTLSCTCGHLVGSMTTSGKATTDTHPAAIYKLNKHCLSVSSSSGLQLYYTLPWFLAADILERAQAHSSRRFIMQEEESGKRRFLLWLFQPEIKITFGHVGCLSVDNRVGDRNGESNRDSQGDDRGRDQEGKWTHRAVKVMWLDMDGHDSNTLNLSQAETLTYPEVDIDTIGLHLQGKNQDWYINGGTGLGEYRIGFFPRI